MRLLTQSLSQPSVVPWIAASLLVAVVATNFAWRYGSVRLSGLDRWREAPALPAMFWLLQSLFLLLPPFIAWRSGALSPYYLGVAENDWLAALAIGGLLAAIISGISLFAWLVYRRELRGLHGVRKPPVLLVRGRPPALSGVGLPPGVNPARLHRSETRMEGAKARANSRRLAAVSTPAWWGAPVNALLRQWHWAFYRAAAITWLAAATLTPPDILAGTQAWPGADLMHQGLLHLSEDPLYWGSWLALGLIVLEALPNPFWRHALRTPGLQEHALLRVGMALATAALFALTRNFWLCAACDVAVEGIIARWFPLPTTA